MNLTCLAAWDNHEYCSCGHHGPDFGPRPTTQQLARVAFLAEYRSVPVEDAGDHEQAMMQALSVAVEAVDALRDHRLRLGVAA